MDSDDIGAIVLIIFICACIALFVYLGIQDDNQFEKFKTEHHCKLVAHIKGDITPGFGVSSSGKTVMTTNFNSDKNGWLCDDGVTYYRDE